MISNSLENEKVVVSYKSLIIPIKLSHHILLRQLYSSIGIIPILVVFFLILQTYIPTILSDYMTVLFLSICGAAAIWIIKKSYTFIHSGGRSVLEIEQATTISQLNNGLLSYFNHVADYLIPPTLRGKKSASSLNDSLDRLENYLNKGIKPMLTEISAILMFIMGVVTFFRINPSELSIPVEFYLIICIMISLFVIRWLLSFKWRPQVKKWVNVSRDLAI